MSTETAIFYDRMAGRRNDAYAVDVVKEECASHGYCIDRLREVKAAQHGLFWKYEVPVVRVVS